MALVRRNPFARTELHRESVDANGATCKWCGNVRRTPKGKAKLYQYRTESDGGRKAAHPGLFCSIGCLEIYSGN